MDEVVLAGDKAIADWLTARGYRANARAVKHLRRRARHPIPSNPTLARVLIRESTLRRWLEEESRALCA